MSQVWFTSDEHIGHKNVIEFCNRPFADLLSMREGLLERHNSVVEPGDLVYHLGDMFWRTCSPLDALQYLQDANGQHYYIRGNHEELLDKHATLRNCFVWTKEREKIKPEGGPRDGIVLDHFAGRVWHRSDTGSWQLYGHSHAELPEDPSLLSFDVGVDANDYYPVSLGQVRSRMEKKLGGMQKKIDNSKRV